MQTSWRRTVTATRLRTRLPLWALAVAAAALDSLEVEPLGGSTHVTDGCGSAHGSTASSCFSASRRDEHSHHSAVLAQRREGLF